MKKDLKKTKIGTVVVKGTITEKQEEAIHKLIGVLGSNVQDVVGKIIVLWLYNEGFLKEGRDDK
jgi:RNA-binding protein YhbY